MKNTRAYAILNSKDLTLKEYHLTNDDFGKVYCAYSRNIIDLGECKKYVNPVCRFIALASDYLKDEYNSLVEVLENKSYFDMEEEFKKLF